MRSKRKTLEKVGTFFLPFTVLFVAYLQVQVFWNWVAREIKSRGWWKSARSNVRVSLLFFVIYIYIQLRPSISDDPKTKRESPSSFFGRDRFPRPRRSIDGKKSIEIDRFPFRSYERAWKYFFFFFSRSVKWSDKLNFVFYYRLINREESLFSCLYSYTGPTFAEFIGGSEYSLHSRYYSVAARKNEQNNCCSIVRTFVTNARPSERSHSEKAVT